MLVIGTFISLILTQLLVDIIDNIQRAQNRRMTAMMVLGNIESFARMLDNYSDAMARNDTVGMWLLEQPVAYLDSMPAEELDKLTNEALRLRFISRDHTAENIFESSLDTKATDYYTPQLSADSLITMPPIMKVDGSVFSVKVSTH